MTDLSRRAAFRSTTALVAVPFALAACSNFATTAGAAAGSAAVTKAVAYVQAGVSSLNAVLVAFGANIPATVSAAMTDLENVATQVGASVTSGLSTVTTGTTLATVEKFGTIAVDAVVAGLSVLPGGGTITAAINIAKDVGALWPAVTALANTIISPATVAVPVAAAANPALGRLKLVM